MREMLETSWNSDSRFLAVFAAKVTVLRTVLLDANPLENEVPSTVLRITSNHAK
jgi:hypothetical protein